MERVLGRVASVTVADSRLFEGVTHVTFSWSPGASASTSTRSVTAERTAWPANATIVSPLTMPALAAGEEGTTATTRAPCTVVDGALDDPVPELTTRTPRNAALRGTRMRGPGPMPGAGSGMALRTGADPPVPQTL